MKIDDTSVNVRTEKGTLVDKTVSTSVKNVNASFQVKFNDAQDAATELRLNELMECITRQGKRLEKKADIKELRIYKKYVSQFLNEALSASHEFTKQNVLDRRGRSRVYAVIKKVDEKLALLAEQVLSSEKDNLKIVSLLDSIKGLILDIML